MLLVLSARAVLPDGRMAVVAMVRVMEAAEHWSQQATKKDRDDASGQGGATAD